MNLELIAGIILYGCVLFVMIAGAFASHMQATTLFVGKKIAPQGMDTEMPRGLQDAITPSIQNFFNTMLPICYVVIVILGSFQYWYFGVLLLIISFTGLAFMKKLFPNKLNFYLKILIFYMANKVADYAKDGDQMRAQAAQEVSDKLSSYYYQVKDSNAKVPNFTEIKSMPLGY